MKFSIKIISLLLLSFNLMAQTNFDKTWYTGVVFSYTINFKTSPPTVTQKDTNGAQFAAGASGICDSNGDSLAQWIQKHFVSFIKFAIQWKIEFCLENQAIDHQ